MGPRIVMKTTSPAPVASVLPSKATAAFPLARRSAMMPEPMTIATSRAVPRNSAARRRCNSPAIGVSGTLQAALAELFDLVLDGEPAKLLERQGSEDLDPVLDLAEHVEEQGAFLHIRTDEGGGIGEPPMGADGLARPDRTDFARGLIADREDEIHHRHAGCGKLVPALASQVRRRQLEQPQQIER